MNGQSGFWKRLSPLGADPTPTAPPPSSGSVRGGGPVDLHCSGIDGSMDDLDPHDEDDEEVVSW